MENIVIIDALSVTSKIHSPYDLIDILGLEKLNWKVVKGSHGYKNRLYYDTISIHYDGTPEMGIWLEMMGQGCRAFETYGNGDFDSLFQLILDNPDDMNITRLDVAYDDHTGIVDINQILSDTRNQYYQSRFNNWEVIEGSKGSSVLHGSYSSEMLVRIYDKAMERKYKDGWHWIRIELQMRRERAMEFIKKKVILDKYSQGYLLIIFDILSLARIRINLDGLLLNIGLT